MHSVSTEELTEHEKSMFMEFKADGSVTHRRGDMSREGVWEMREQNGVASIYTNVGGREQENEIKTLDENTLSIVDRGAIVTLKRR